ncbi:MAG: NAD(P)-dependent alcohol dehydrogenase [Proteobacteria bacterium]|nr:MAG: NAD(P)-dependent alcohol dehydrogenase [Pseudomonadota bacterium]
MSSAPLSSRPSVGLASLAPKENLQPWSFTRRALRPSDVAIRTLFCGVCHSDLHAIKDGWAGEYPIVPGHELMGVVTAVGEAVVNFKVGEEVLIGNIVDSCRRCQPCLEKMESYCREYPTLTYDGKDRIDGTRTRGGLSDTYIADEAFVYHLPKGMDPAAAAPLLCAGITVFSPLRHWGAGPGKVVGVIGIGGLGHLAIKIARAMGAHVVAFTTSEGKVKEALRLGAHEAVLSTDAAAMSAQAYRIDLFIDTVARTYAMDPYLNALKLDGVLCSLGIPDKFDFKPLLLTLGRRSIASSGSGGTRETQEMLDFCQQHGIVSEIEMVTPEGLDGAFQRLAKGDVRYRFVLDLRNGIKLS